MTELIVNKIEKFLFKRTFGILMRLDVAQKPAIKILKIQQTEELIELQFVYF